MKQKNQYTQWLVRQIAEGDPMLHSAAFYHLSEQMQLQWGTGKWFCIAVRFSNPVNMISDVTYTTMLFSACQMAERACEGKMYCYIGTGAYVVMVVEEKSEQSEVVQNLHHYISQKCEYPVQFGVGRSREQLEKLCYSRVEAYEALGNMSNLQEISYIEDIYVSRNITTRKMESQKRRIIELFKNGQLVQLNADMEQLVENVRSESPVRRDSPYPTSIRRTILEVLLDIMHICSDAGVDVEALIGPRDPYGTIFNGNTATPILLEWFSNVVRELYHAMCQRYTHTENNMLNIAKVYIENNLSNPALSLSQLSEVLGITPTYLSAFFIRETGVGFNEYITNSRIERAKQLLQQTNKKIGQIAIECGFRSASYFIVVFRKKNGVSPGEYRKRKNITNIESLV